MYGILMNSMLFASCHIMMMHFWNPVSKRQLPEGPQETLMKLLKWIGSLVDQLMKTSDDLSK